jgi:ferredoxin-thioredoxin reductase catalytic chain
LTTIGELKRRAETDAKTNGCYLNPDSDFLQDLLEGLQKNIERYGYQSCPCRLASGKFELDRDIICPCDYRDPDVTEYDQCYCSLYVSKNVHDGKASIHPIPERRPVEKQGRAYASSDEASKKLPEKEENKAEKSEEIKMKLWYCKQCGYVCFREEPPYICPICKANKEMFAELDIRTKIQEKQS